MYSINPIRHTLKTGIRLYAIRHFFGRPKPSLGECNIVEIGEVSPELFVPENIRKPKYYYEDYEPDSSIIGRPGEIKDSTAIAHMRESCKLAANILKKCTEIVKVGTTTDEIDRFVHSEAINANAYPSPLRYHGFPKSVCTSVNNVACHGIPDNRPLMDGDIINVDITVFLNGYHGDCSKMFFIGNVDERGRFLVDVTEKCLMEAINSCGPYRPFNVIGKKISRIAKENGLTVVPAFTGHGIGSYFHGPPEILHFKNSIYGLMEPGMTFTIEPVLSLGSEAVEIQEDGWTAMSIDGSRSAQIEHTVLITENGVDILTQ